MGNSDILIREITRKSEIVDNCTWVLVNDGSSNVLIHRASKDVAKALSDGMRCYYVSPDVFVGDFHFDNVLFSEKPDGLSVDVSFRMKLLPEMSGFADWVKANVEYKLTIDGFVERLAKPKYGLKQFLQHSLEGVTNFDLLRKHGKEAVPAFAGQDKSLDPWLYVVGMQWIEADDIPASKRNWLNEFSVQQEERAKELDRMRSDLSFATEKGNLEDALKVVAHRQRLSDLTREVECLKTEGALKDVEIENANKELELLERKRKISILSKAETDRYDELENILEKYHAAQGKIEKLEGEMRHLIAEKDKEDPDAWYNNLTVKAKIFRHIRTIFASVFYIAGYVFFLYGCGVRSKDHPETIQILADYAFVYSGVSWIIAMFLNGRSVKNTFADIKHWVAQLFAGKPMIDIPYIVCTFFRYLAGCYLVICGMIPLYAFGGLFVWGFLGFQKDFFVSYEVVFMAISGITLGAYVLGMKLMMRRRIHSSANSARKWIMIMGVPLLLFFFFDKNASDRIKWPNADKKAAKQAVKEFGSKNYEKAWQLVEKADKTDVALCAHLGDAYANGYGTKIDYAEAIKYYLKVEEANPNSSIEYQIGFCYYNLEDYKQSGMWMEKAAGNGDKEAWYFLGLFYEFGSGNFIKNLPKSLECYNKAYNSSIKKTSLEKAIERVKAAIREKASFDLEDEMYKSFNDEDYKRVWQLMPDANQNSLRVLAIKADSYVKGLGVQTNYQLAFECYKKVWERMNGNKRVPEIELNAGFCKLMLKDYQEAVKWLKLATSHGNVNAWFYLGCCYEECESFKDLTLALECYKKALKTTNAGFKITVMEYIKALEAKIKSPDSRKVEKAKLSDIFKPIK